MINHLKKKGHSEELKKYQSGECMSSNVKARKITSFFDQQQTVDARQRKVDDELVRIQARQNASMYFFDDEDVQASTKKAYPDLQVFGRLHFCRVVIPAMAQQIKNNIAQQIGSGYFSITSDGWQKPSKFPALLSVTTHTVDDDFDRLDNVLATIPMEKDHTGEEIARLIEQLWQKNGLNSDRIVAMVRDDASNMQRLCRLLKIDSFQCAAHFYHHAASVDENEEEVDEIDAVLVEDENSMDFDDSIWSTKQKVAVGSVLDSRSRLKAQLKAELSHYRHNSDRPAREQDIFAWWKKNKERFPLIAKEARILLSVPGTLVSSERTFSIAGLWYANTLRNRLSCRMAEMLILIKANLKKLKLAPSTELDDEEVGKEKGSESDNNINNNIVCLRYMCCWSIVINEML